MFAQENELQNNEACRRMIAAASEEFARNGFGSARVRHIVDAARVNLAAVNYYFGGKEGLYRATLRYLAQHAPPRTTGDEKSGAPEHRLLGQVAAILERYIGGRQPSALGRILAHESMNPTVHAEPLIEDMLRPDLEQLRGLVREIAGHSASDTQVTHAAMSVVGQCFFNLFARNALDRIDPGSGRGDDEMRELARHITDFSLHGFRCLGEVPKKGGADDQSIAAVSDPPCAWEGSAHRAARNPATSDKTRLCRETEGDEQ